MIRKCHIIQYETLVKNNEKPKDGAITLIESLLKRHIPFLIVTDRSNQTKKELCIHMRAMGFPTFSEGVIYTSTMAARDWIARKYPTRIKANYIGGRGLKEVLVEAGFVLNCEDPHWIFIGSESHLDAIDLNRDIQKIKKGAVLISTDSSREHIDRDKQCIAAGAITRLLEYAANTKALEFGRPSLVTLSYALRYTGYKEDEVRIVSDEYGADILPALQCHYETAFVATDTSFMEIQKDKDLHPKWIVDSLSGLAH